ncbi:MAG: cache domain-containing protein [Burkholderiaceae bacterium]
MKLRDKILLLAAVPLLVALASVVLAVRYQALALAQREKSLVESAWLAARQTELANYVGLARSAIEPLLRDDASDPAQARRRALDLLSRMEFGTDGYFFVYDLQGRNLMHPRQPELIGQDLSALRDRDGRPVIQALLAAARDGHGQGRPVRYLWEKPSTHQIVEKLGHVIAIDRWQWMIGTGLYQDDIAQALARIDQTAQANIDALYLSVIVIAALALLAVTGCGLALNISDHRQADAQLRRMARRLVHSQEDERARLSRELHDGVGQKLISIKLLLEAAMPANALDRLDETIKEVRQLSHDLRPPLLDDLGLPSALAHLLHEQPAPPATTLTVRGEPAPLSQAADTALFRIAQQALANALRHASATRIDVTLAYDADGASLTVADDGRGFDPAAVRDDPDAGIGLRNMHERVEALAGTLTIRSGERGTRVIARVPRRADAETDARAASTKGNDR